MIHMDEICDLVQQNTPTTTAPSNNSIQPKSFFMAWNSVPCLVFDGFPPSIVSMKQNLNNDNKKTTTKIIKWEENFGSKWPKITLGYPIKTIQTIKELDLFQRICQSMDEEILEFRKCYNDDGKIEIQTISVVHYKQRSLEEIIERRDFHISTSTTKTSPPVEVQQPGHPDLDLDLVVESKSTTTTTAMNNGSKKYTIELPSQEEQDRVNNVIKEWDDTITYLERIRPLPSQPYRDGSPTGYCCVVFLLENLKRIQIKQHDDKEEESNKHTNDDLPIIMKIIHKFQSKIDKEFPNRFVWMDDTSLHCTIRAMDPI